MLQLVLERTYEVDGTNGILQVDGKTLCYTIELPWIANKRQISCIPEGTYKVQKRFSPKFKHHFELVDVPHRSYILIHTANDAQKELRGCIAPVSQLIGNGKGSRSVLAMNKLKEVLYSALEKGEVQLQIVRRKG
ncbi:MAG: DUF5675 family protein [Flavobacteriaceae bacterium]|jgi:hypothetical protein|nr:DUF5675 family protein [Flavobacteriaceae bacterium]